MQIVSDKIIAQLREGESNLHCIPFLVGFHAVPSMKRLHLHVISSDLISGCLKTKQHWNSFTTKFFVPLQVVLGDIEMSGEFSVDKEAVESLLKKDLECHKCNMRLKKQTLPTLKEHVASCSNEFVPRGITYYRGVSS